MVFNTATVGGAVTPAVIATFISHYLNRKPLAQKPTAHISYDEGLHLIRKFLIYASHHTVEDIQRFTSQWVPHQTWVKVDEVKIPAEYLTKSAEAIQEQLGHHGIEKVGGKLWWQWRRPESEMEAEWIEMKADHAERRQNNDKGKRVMLYVHGGAYFFGSVDEHRYQMQRHARKLKARVFAPRYRLAPQFPFPCGLQDCLAAYLYLLSVQDPSTIILAGDSAGGGMVMSMLVTLRDRGLPLPAGAILISPWVDLTHSFPSVAADNPLDYIPPHGFHQRPSPSWPPPNADDMLAMAENAVKGLTHKEHISRELEEDAVQGFHVDKHPDAGTKNDTAATGTATNDGSGPAANTVPGPGHDLSIMIDGKLIEIKDQLQMYTTNQLISHPLISTVLQPSLGGLPPLLVLVGGGEMLRDEQIYLAHKAANPTKYTPGDAFLDENPHEHNRNQVNRWKPTDVQLQVWDDLCHVAPTLSFTRPAKYMYRSIAQFGAWALARAQQTEIDIMDDDDISVVSQSDSSREGSINNGNGKDQSIFQKEEVKHVGKAGDPLPPFKHHMIRQRVDRHGNIYELDPESSLPACTMPNSQIGVIKEGPVKKWMATKKEWDTKFASAKRNVQNMRMKEMATGYESFGHGEVPPPSALAGRRTARMKKAEKKKKSTGMSMWALWGSKHDKLTMDREQAAEEKDKGVATIKVTAANGAGARPLDDQETDPTKLHPGDKWTKRRISHRRTVTDLNQTGHDSPHQSQDSLADGNDHTTGSAASLPTPTIIAPTIVESAIANAPAEEFDLKRPKAAGIAFPFTIKNKAASASMTTLTSTAEISPGRDITTSDALEDGVGSENAKEPGLLGLPFGLKQQGTSASMTTLTSAVGVPPGKDVLTVEALTSGVKSDVVQNGDVVTSSRPPLETFVTAPEIKTV